MLAFFVVTAAVQLLSAYGAVCVAWDPVSTYATFPYGPKAGELMWPYAIDNLTIFKISNIITWVGTLVWGYIIYGLLTQKKHVCIMALINSFISFVMGLIPALIADLSKVDPDAIPAPVTFSIGSPHWARTFANALVFLLLVLPPVFKSLLAFTAEENKMTGDIAKQLMMMSMFFFWLSIVSFLGTTFMASAHVVQGINVWQTVEIQSIGSYTTAILGVSMLGGGFILKQFKPSRSLITTVEVNNQ